MPSSKDRLYRKRTGGTFYGWYYLPSGARRYVCTWCRDRKAAAAALRRLEREAQSPPRPTSNAAPLSGVLHAFIHDTEVVRRKSKGTVHCYTVKAGHLLRLLGETTSVNSFGRETESGYVESRRAEGAHDHTIQKELVVLRAALKLAKHDGIFEGDLAAIRTRHAPNYQPRRTYLTPKEYGALLRALPERRRATVAFIVLTAARDSEWRSITAEHIDFESVVTLPGTKTINAWRHIPLRDHTDLSRLLRTVLAGHTDRAAVLFPSWGNVRRDLHVACDAARIARVSPNDLRRTFATWCWQGGMHPARIAFLLGHRDARMVERVYGVLDAASLGREVAKVFAPLRLPTMEQTGAPRSVGQKRDSLRPLKLVAPTRSLPTWSPVGGRMSP